MIPSEPDEQAWILHLSQTYSLRESLVERLVEEIRASSSQTLEEFVVVRHLKLRAEGFDNEEIYRRIQHEVVEMRFRAPELSLRQIRRMIYG